MRGASVQFLPLLGIPFLTGGRTRAGIDCLGLVLAGLQVMGIPWQDPWDRIAEAWKRGERSVQSALPEGWTELPAETPLERGDVVMSRNAAGVVQHVALVIDVARNLLHTSEGTGSVITPARAVRGRIVAVFRWRPTP